MKRQVGTIPGLGLRKSPQAIVEGGLEVGGLKQEGGERVDKANQQEC